MEDFSSFQADAQSALVTTVRTASGLAQQDLAFHRSLSASFATRLDNQNARLLGLASSLLGSAATTAHSVRAAPSLRDVDSVEDNWRAVVDVVDSLLERADTALDEFTGAVKRLTPDAEVQIATSKPARPSKIAQPLKAQEIEKPQLSFQHPANNHDTTPFVPLLQTKPHAKIPMATEPTFVEEASQRRTFAHPYQTEIEQYEYPAAVSARSEPIPYLPFDSTSATVVDTEEAVEEMLQELKGAKEIAIDLEHHDLRSYAGIVCLMQISTRNRDWIVDTLKPWRQKLQCLNQVFADPRIVKVLHGAFMDIVWLQRDLGLYVVGLFDTFHAARTLGYPAGSLAFLLKKFADVDANKQYQMADWRIRPLPQHLIDYARSDTHYLLYIFDMMRNELIDRSKLDLPDRDGDKLFHVLQKSTETALQRYEHPVYDLELGQGSGGWHKILSRTPAMFSPPQFAVFKAVHQWRDQVAREQDDSTHFVMPNHQIFSIARELPTNRAALLGLTQPTTQTVRLRADELVNVITDAKESGKNGPAMMDVLTQIEPRYTKGPPTNSAPTQSVAETLRALRTAPNSSAIESPSALPLRSTASTFWGSALSNASSGHHDSLSTGAGVMLYIPLPPAATGFVENSNEAKPPQPSAPLSPEGVEAASAQYELDDIDDAFVLKELSKKRKREIVATKALPSSDRSDVVTTQSDEVVLSTEETERLRERAERKMEKKEAKKAAKLAAMAAQDTTEAAAPFDYASAPSMLHPAPDTSREGSKKQIKPYSKLTDAPKGMPRNPSAKERAGRSMTYR